MTDDNIQASAAIEAALEEGKEQGKQTERERVETDCPNTVYPSNIVDGTESANNSSCNVCGKKNPCKFRDSSMCMNGKCPIESIKKLPVFQWCVVKSGWENAGKIGKVLGPTIFRLQYWVPVGWNDEEDPDFQKDASLIFLDTLEEAFKESGKILKETKRQ